MIPALLRHNIGFRRLWAGQTISLFGDQVSLIAFPLVAVLVLHAGAAQMGYITAAATAPNLLFALHLGAWIDRRGRRRQLMVVSDLGRAALIVTVPIAYAAGHLTVTQLYVVGFLTGTLTVVFRIAQPSLITTVVPRDEYVPANQWLNGSRALSYVGGPSLGGFLVQLLSGPAALIADAVSYVGSAIFVGRIHAEEPVPEGSKEGRLGTGLRLIWNDALLRSSLISATVVNLFSYAVLAIILLYMSRTLHLRPGPIGLVMGAGAVGGIIGSYATGPLSRRFGVGPVYIAGMILYPLPVFLAAAASGSRTQVYAMFFTAEFISGFGVMLLDILAGSLFQAIVPDNLRSRFSGAFMFVNYGVRPIGSLLGGLGGVIIGLRSTMWVAVAGAVLGACYLVFTPTRHVRELPGPAVEAAADQPDLATAGQP